MCTTARHVGVLVRRVCVILVLVLARFCMYSRSSLVYNCRHVCTKIILGGRMCAFKKLEDLRKFWGICGNRRKCETY